MFVSERHRQLISTPSSHPSPTAFHLFQILLFPNVPNIYAVALATRLA